MCMVSNIGDNWPGTLPQKWPHIFPSEPADTGQKIIIQSGVSQADFDALKREVEELKKLLLAAKEFDEKTGQPHCEMDAKVALIKRIAKVVGVDLGDVFEKPKRKKKSK